MVNSTTVGFGSESFKLQHSSCKHVVSLRVENNVDPYQPAPQEPTDLDLHCFLKKINLGSAEQG